MSYMPSIGDRVVRGPTWKWGNQDRGGPGTVVDIDSEGWAHVRWDGRETLLRGAYHGGYHEAYRTPAYRNECCDLAPAPVTVEAEPCVRPPTWSPRFADPVRVIGGSGKIGRVSALRRNGCVTVLWGEGHECGYQVSELELADSPPPPPAPRYVVLTAEEMAGMEGRKCDRFTRNDENYGLPSRRSGFYNSGQWTFTKVDKWGEPHALKFTCAIVDTQDGWRPAGIPLYTEPGAKVVTSPPMTWTDVGTWFKRPFEDQAVPFDGPTETVRIAYDPGRDQWIAMEDGKPPRTNQALDAAIVAAWGKEEDAREKRRDASGPIAGRVTSIPIGGTHVSLADYQSARSRELLRMSQEAEAKRRLPCQPDDADDLAADAPCDLADMLDPFARCWR